MLKHRNREIVPTRIICVVCSVWDLLTTQNSSKYESQSPSFSSFNHEGQSQRALDEITTTQTTKPVFRGSLHLLRSIVAPSPRLYSLSLSIPLFSSSVSLQSRIIHAGVFPASYKENPGMKSLVIPPKQIGIRPGVAATSRRIEPISLRRDVLTQL